MLTIKTTVLNTIFHNYVQITDSLTRGGGGGRGTVEGAEGLGYSVHP